jgi:hypothetical protein
VKWLHLTTSRLTGDGPGLRFQGPIEECLGGRTTPKWKSNLLGRTFKSPNLHVESIHWQRLTSQLGGGVHHSTHKGPARKKFLNSFGIYTHIEGSACNAPGEKREKKKIALAFQSSW